MDVKLNKIGRDYVKNTKCISENSLPLIVLMLSVAFGDTGIHSTCGFRLVAGHLVERIFYSMARYHSREPHSNVQERASEANYFLFFHCVLCFIIRIECNTLFYFDRFENKPCIHEESLNVLTYLHFILQHIGCTISVGNIVSKFVFHYSVRCKIC